MNFFNFTREDLMQEPTIKKIVESEHIDRDEILTEEVAAKILESGTSVILLHNSVIRFKRRWI